MSLPIVPAPSTATESICLAIAAALTSPRGDRELAAAGQTLGFSSPPP